MTTSGSFESILHPISVHFPVALTITGFVIAIIYLIIKKNPYLNICARIILWLATLSAVAAFITSNFTPHLTGEAELVEDSHHLFAVLTLASLSIASAMYLFITIYTARRIQWMAWTGFIFYFLSALFVGIAGYFGGYIVYNILI